MLRIYWGIHSLFVFIESLILIKKSESMSDAEIKDLQYKKLKKIINYAWKYVPFYKQYWGQHGFSPEHFNCIADISLIPFIDKTTVRTFSDEFLSRKYSKKILTKSYSGGTTGVPTAFYLNKYFTKPREIAYSLYYYWKYYKYYRGIQKVAIIRGFRIDEQLVQRKIFWFKNKREPGLFFSSFHISEENYYYYILKLKEYSPSYIKAYPSSIVALCLLMERHGDYGIPGLKAVICSSETIYDWHRSLIKKMLGVEIYSFYGHSEKLCCAYQNKDEMIFPPFYGYVEFQKCDDNLFEIVATTYEHNAFPLIRYRTSDIVEMNASHVRKILGRKQDFVYDKNGDIRIFTCEEELFFGIDGIMAYQYVQNQMGLLELHIETNNEFSESSLTIIQKRGKECFDNIDINIELVSSIPRTSSGKFRYLIQNIQEKEMLVRKYKNP